MKISAWKAEGEDETTKQTNIIINSQREAYGGSSINELKMTSG